MILVLQQPLPVSLSFIITIRITKEIMFNNIFLSNYLKFKMFSKNVWHDSCYSWHNTEYEQGANRNFYYFPWWKLYVHWILRWFGTPIVIFLLNLWSKIKYIIHLSWCYKVIICCIFFWQENLFWFDIWTIFRLCTRLHRLFSINETDIQN